MKNNKYEKDADVKDYFYINHNYGSKGKTATHFHKSLEIVFVYEGKYCVLINGEERVLTDGEVVVSSAYDVHRYHAVDYADVFVLVIGGKYLTRFQESYGGRVGPFGDFGENKERFKNFLTDIHYNYHTYNDLMLMGTVDYLLGFVSQACGASSAARKKGNILLDVFLYIDENYTENITAEHVADKFGYSKSHFSSLFNSYCGTGFRDYLNHVRIEAVQKEVEKNGTAISKAAMSCGFNSLNTFYRAYNRFKSSQVKKPSRINANPN